MWEAKSQNRSNQNGVQPMIEVLEDRQMMSVVAHHEAAAPKAPAPHAIVMSVKPAAKVATRPAAKQATTPAAPPTQNNLGELPAFVPATNLNMAPDVVGKWTGTMLVDGTTQANPFSINFAFQRGIAASGIFNLGPTVSNQSLTSTLVFGTSLNTRALILTSTLWMGFTGALTANGQILYGRFAVNTSNGWETGTYNLTRN